MPDSIEKIRDAFKEARAGRGYTKHRVLSDAIDELEALRGKNETYRNALVSVTESESRFHEQVRALTAELEALRGQQERVRGLVEKWRAGAKAALIPGDLWRGFAKAELVLADELDAALGRVKRSEVDA